jgi:hypothetical protein
MNKIARDIWKIPSRTTRRAGVRAAAAMVLNEDCENMFEIAEILWELAAGAGFKPLQTLRGSSSEKGFPWLPD